MKTIVPDYYKDFRCIAGSCRHTCCQGWEIDIDEVSLDRFGKIGEINQKICRDGETPHIILEENERCPFLRDDGLCSMILTYGEDMLCDICRDHPRFRNFCTDRVEIGLGMVCEAAAKLILSHPDPMKLVVFEDDGEDRELPDDEAWLMDYRQKLLDGITESGPRARLLEYLIFRHIPDALYDDMLEERTAFVRAAYEEIISAWEKTDGSADSLAECARIFSYDVEYDDEVMEKRLEELSEK